MYVLNTAPIVYLALKFTVFIVSFVLFCFVLFCLFVCLFVCFFFFFFRNNFSFEFDEFRVDTHLCKLRATPVALFLSVFTKSFFLDTE